MLEPPYSGISHFFYVSPNPGFRLKVDPEIFDLSSTIIVPWCIIGDFNIGPWCAGDAPMNQTYATAFVNCIDDCNLTDLGFSGHHFTCMRDQLQKRLDRFLCNTLGHELFLNNLVVHLHILSSNYHRLCFSCVMVNFLLKETTLIFWCMT